jgi:hypothetical protein
MLAIVVAPPAAVSPYANALTTVFGVLAATHNMAASH